jgi:hypothetical protein
MILAPRATLSVGGHSPTLAHATLGVVRSLPAEPRQEVLDPAGSTVHDSLQTQGWRHVDAYRRRRERPRAIAATARF